MSTHIVITSIFEPTPAILKFSKISDCKLIVVGDKKTPKDWNCKNATFLDVDLQSNLGYEIEKYLPYNHYCRKMLGYIYSIKEGASAIVDTDDDNFPKESWGFPSFVGNFDTLNNNLGFINIYKLFTDKNIWPRGLPLSLIKKSVSLKDKTSIKECNIGIWQGLADEDPDVDAIYRLLIGDECYFNEREPIVLSEGTISPFNSQNTLIRSELFPLLYLPSTTTFRFTDILRGLIAQPIMWAQGYKLGFTNASVTQFRNSHILMKDFESEIPMYLDSENALDVASSAVSKNRNISDNLHAVYKALVQKEIVNKDEMKILEAWLRDIENSSPPKNIL